ncbi:hypothetical protein STEG23_016287, partial [Scotinomys teguina]
LTFFSPSSVTILNLGEGDMDVSLRSEPSASLIIGPWMITNSCLNCYPTLLQKTNKASNLADGSWHCDVCTPTSTGERREEKERRKEKKEKREEEEKEEEKEEERREEEEKEERREEEEEEEEREEEGEEKGMTRRRSKS